MPSTMDAPDTEHSIALDYMPGVRGHGVLMIGPDTDGAKALAVWKLGPAGHAGGAWIMPIDAMERDADRASEIVGVLRGRCLVDWDTERPQAIVDRVRHLLPGQLADELAGNVLAFGDLLKEIAEQRQRCVDAVDAYRATTKSKIVELS